MRDMFLRRADLARFCGVDAATVTRVMVWAEENGHRVDTQMVPEGQLVSVDDFRRMYALREKTMRAERSPARRRTSRTNINYLPSCTS